VRTIRAFFGWLVREGLIETNIDREIRPPKIFQKVITTLSDDEILCILKACKPTNSSNNRNQTIFMLLLDKGMRIGGLVNLKIEGYSYG